MTFDVFLKEAKVGQGHQVASVGVGIFIFFLTDSFRPPCTGVERCGGRSEVLKGNESGGWGDGSVHQLLAEQTRGPQFGYLATALTAWVWSHCNIMLGKRGSASKDKMGEEDIHTELWSPFAHTR